MSTLSNQKRVLQNKTGEKIKKIDEGKRMNNETKELKIQKIVESYIRALKKLENEFAKTKRNHKNKTKNFTK